MARANLSHVFVVILGTVLCHHSAEFYVPDLDHSNVVLWQKVWQCYEEILGHYFPTNHVTVISSDVFLLNSIVHTERAVSQAIQPATNSNAIVLILQNLKELSTLLDRGAFWDASSVFFVVMADKAKNISDLDKSRLFQMFWDDRIVRVALLTIENDQVEVYGFNPFSKGACKTVKVFLLADTKPGSLSITRHLAAMSKGNIDLEGCDVILSYMDFPPFVISKKQASQKEHLEGIEGRLMQTVASVLHFTPTYRSRYETQWGGFEPPSGLLGDVYTASSEIGFGLLFSFASRYEHLDVAVPHNVDACVGWLVPKGAGYTSPVWISMFIAEFSYSLWLMVAFSFCLAYLGFFVSLYDVTSSSNRHANYWVTALASFLGLPTFEMNTTRFRIFIISWIWFSYVITTAYRSSMSSMLTAPTADPDIKTLRELAKSKLHLTGPFNAFRIVELAAEEELGDTQKIIASRFEVKNYTAEEVVDQMVSSRNLAFLRHSSSLFYVSLLKSTTKGMVYVVDECAYQYYPWILLPKHSHLTKSVNKVITGLNEGGIIALWSKQLLPSFSGTISEEVRKLRVTDIVSVFVFLVLGYFVAAVVFIFELIAKKVEFTREKRKDRNKNKKETFKETAGH